ncbi:hypothetical protein [Sphingobium yanoikuyae]|nr:hypothetical protein [Sphingobium yanoikuyae]WQE05635.1 hypothetical protein U0025_15085 [Sphingobium yanoikuyae]
MVMVDHFPASIDRSKNPAGFGHLKASHSAISMMCDIPIPE